MPSARPDTYSRNQLIGHWAVVLLVLMQFLLNGAMVRTFEEGVEAGQLPLDGGAVMHAAGGTTILLVMLWRLSMRFTHGAPPPPASESSAIQMLSRGTHWAFYVVLIAMPVLGLTAVFTLSPFVARLHSLTSWLILALIALHVAGAVWHMARRDSEAWHRMLRRDPADRAETL